MTRISYAHSSVIERDSHSLPTIDSLLDQLKKIDNEMGILLLDQNNTHNMD
jgi:hypothetical protein